jgi:hypothetical protein
MPFDDFRYATDGEIRRNKKGRPRVDPAAPLTGAERAARHRAKHGDKLNRKRRLRRKVAKLMNGGKAESVAHQRIIRDASAIDPAEVDASLSRYTVETIDKAVGKPFIKQHEWLRTTGNATMFYGLFAPDRDLQGVVGFGLGPHSDICRVIGSPAFCLERGACSPRAPPNAASFLITRACKQVCRITGTPIFYAYADPAAGEYGAVYQAAGWVYLGQGIKGGRTRTHRHAVLAPGRDADDPAQWQTSRALRSHGRRRTMQEAVDAGWLIATRPAKHVYAVNVGRGRKAWLKGLTVLPYPKPRPELAMAAKAMRQAG